MSCEVSEKREGWWRSAISQALKLTPPLAAAITAMLMLILEWNREEDLLQRLTFQEIRSHKLRLTEIKTAHVCAAALLAFPEYVGRRAQQFRGTKKRFKCDEDWCVWYRRCIGSTVEMVPDNIPITITEDIAWSVALPIRSALESYESLSHLACTNTLDRQLVLEQFRTELHPNSDIVNYVKHFYPPTARNSTNELPGMTGVLGALYPKSFHEWENRWANTCM